MTAAYVWVLVADFLFAVERWSLLRICVWSRVVRKLVAICSFDISRIFWIP